MDVVAHIVSAFTRDGLGGNHAGVVLDAEAISAAERRAVAKSLAYSETAFVERSDIAIAKISFYTPTSEVDYCGHALLGACTALLECNRISIGTHALELASGIFTVTIEARDVVWAQQQAPKFLQEVSYERLSQCFEEPCSMPSTPQIVSTGLPDIIALCSTTDELSRLRIRPDKLSQLNEVTNSVGLHVCALTDLNSTVVAHARNFAPLYGINEESATGSSTGALACFLHAHNLLRGRNLRYLEFWQGDSLGEPSRLLASLSVDAHGQITHVFVGGHNIYKGKRIVSVVEDYGEIG